MKKKKRLLALLMTVILLITSVELNFSSSKAGGTSVPVTVTIAGFDSQLVGTTVEAKFKSTENDAVTASGSVKKGTDEISTLTLEEVYLLQSVAYTISLSYTDESTNTTYTCELQNMSVQQGGTDPDYTYTMSYISSSDTLKFDALSYNNIKINVPDAPDGEAAYTVNYGFSDGNYENPYNPETGITQEGGFNPNSNTSIYLQATRKSKAGITYTCTAEVKATAATATAIWSEPTTDKYKLNVTYASDYVENVEISGATATSEGYYLLDRGTKYTITAKSKVAYRVLSSDEISDTTKEVSDGLYYTLSGTINEPSIDNITITLKSNPLTDVKFSIATADGDKNIIPYSPKGITYTLVSESLPEFDLSKAFDLKWNESKSVTYEKGDGNNQKVILVNTEKKGMVRRRIGYNFCNSDCEKRLC